MSILAYTLLSVTIVSLISLIGTFTLSINKKVLDRSIFFLVSLAVGALFGDAIIHLIPEAFASFENTTTPALLIIVGIFIFFILEKFLHWHHCHGNHDSNCDVVRPLGRLILFSDGVHNFLDGAIIAAAYMVSVEVGIATTFAIILHEIPQEIGDFGVLIHSGYTRARALFVNFLSALVAILGAGFVFLLGDMSKDVTPALIALAAGSFLYIAGSDLVPELHKTSDLKKSVLQFVAIVIGVALVFMV
ncbi:ZIP family metal transporter [candidate division KSB1 bacterium]